MESTVKDGLRDLTRALRLRAQGSDDSEWLSGAKVPPKAAAAKSSAVAMPTPAVAVKPRSLDEISAEIRACRRCPLGATRLNAVPGVGSATASVMFIGEGPGFQEDHRGEPFVGRSGQLLDKILAAIGLSRQTVYIANVVKCHPMKDPTNPESHGNDRKPSPEEIAACRGFLDEQIRLIAPRALVTLGAVPLSVLLPDEDSITRVRGKWRLYKLSGGGAGVKLMPTFHPAALLRNPNLKIDVWKDMKELRRFLAEA